MDVALFSFRKFWAIAACSLGLATPAVAQQDTTQHRLRTVEALRDGPGLPATAAERAAFARAEFPTLG